MRIMIQREYEDGSVDSTTREAIKDKGDYIVQGIWPWASDPTPTRRTTIDGLEVRGLTQYGDRFVVRV